MADIQSGGWSVRDMWNGKEDALRDSTQKFWDRFDSVMLVIMIFYLMIMNICMIISIALLIIGYKTLPFATAKMV